MFAKLRTALIALTLSLTSPAFADEVILTITGDVAAAPDGQAWTFDMNGLRALPSESFNTSTIWTDGVQVFEGVSLAVLLDHVGAAQGSLNAVALNDYAVEIPTSDARAGGPIIAYARNGAAMPVREKGPLWIIYPFDDNSTYKSEEYYTRSIWQLDRIEVVAAE